MPISLIPSFEQNLCYALGYSARQFDSRYSSNTLNIPTYNTTDKALLNDIYDKLVIIDNAIDQNALDSMALAIGDIKVDYNRNMAILKAEGSRYLQQLSQLAGVPIDYDKYLGRSPGKFSKTPLVVRNYS
jgi:hypothetical protein